MGVGRWELGVGSWELGVGSWEIYPPHPAGTPVWSVFLCGGNLRIKPPLQGGDLTGELGEKSPPVLTLSTWRKPPERASLGGAIEPSVRLGWVTLIAPSSQK